MKKNILYLPGKSIIFIFWGMMTVSLFSCNCNRNKKNYYYSGNTKVEITIIRDTLGILLKDTILNPASPVDAYFENVKSLADSNISNLGYTSAGYLEQDDNIKLVLSNKKNKSLLALEKASKDLKSAKNKNFVSNAGYLVRIKGSNKPMILTDEIIIQFKPGTTKADMNNVYSNYGLVVVRNNPFDSMQFTTATTDISPFDALKISQKLKDKPHIEFAQINFIYVKKKHAVRPNDSYFDRQWNLLNQGAVVEDADIHAASAWDFSMGSPDIKIAVIDFGFDAEHYDLASNFSHNRSEIPFNDFDDDENGFIDDTIGWNFNSGTNMMVDLLGHGTAVLGVANAVGNNDTGIIGSCPNCNSIPITSGHMFDRDAFAIGYAQARGANIINCSWDYDGIEVPPNVIKAFTEAVGAGIVIVSSMANENVEYCSKIPGLLNIPSLIFVSRANSNDSYDNSGWGDCMTLLASTGVYGTPAGLLKLITTDVLGYGGYNDGNEDQLNCFPAFSDADYTSCFWGTSASAPLTAGVAGLILSVNNTLTPLQLKYLLQDCADKIENSKGQYSKVNGKSTSGTHGYGRLNAYDALKIASSQTDIGGRNGVDIFVRDNELDWGNTYKPSSYLYEPVRGFIAPWKSMDIKVDAPPYETIPPELNNDFFERLDNENPIGGQINKVYIRVRNRGFNAARDVTIKLHWADACLAFPRLPADFWANFPEDPAILSDWHVIGKKSIARLDYGGPSVIGTEQDIVYIESFDFNTPVHDVTKPRNHYCLMAMIDSPDDPIKTTELLNQPEKFIMDFITSRYNNATHRNYIILENETEASETLQFQMNNPYSYPIFTKPEFTSNPNIPVILGDTLMNQPFLLNAGEKKSVTFKLNTSEKRSATVLEIKQVIINAENNTSRVIGGLTYYIK